jgi:hypothetical protein
MKIPGPKVLGKAKVVIPTKEEVERMELAGSYFHFRERLNQRYKIDVTLDEYLELRRAHIETWKRQTHKIVGIMKIKGVNVLVVREKHRKKKLITALPYHNYKP